MNCSNCNIEIKRKLKTRELAYKNLFCSKSCHQEYRQKNRNSFVCANCGAIVKRTKSSTPTKNSFCSQSCSATFNNSHKSYGYRRSKLEVYFEEQLRKDFPQLELICNSKSLIDSELDFYFPQLKLAVEINGIFHYEPIYGSEKLERIKYNDKQKMIRCYEKGVELCVIDASSIRYLTTNVKEKYYQPLKQIVSGLLGRI